MKTTYNKTQWVDNSTPIDASRLNNIERGIEGLYNNALSPSNLQQGPGINIDSVGDGDIEISLKLRKLDAIPNSRDGETGEYYQDDANHVLYFCLAPGNWIVINSVKFLG